MRVLVTPDYRTLSRTAADLIIKAVGSKPHLCLGVPTGSTPVGMYEELVNECRTVNIDLSRVQTFNLDEFLGLPEGHPNSYRAYMRRHLFDRVNVPPAN